MQVRSTALDRGPVLLVRWESRWRGFFASLSIVLRRCRTPKLYSIPTGVPARSPLALILLHMAFLWLFMRLDPWMQLLKNDFTVPITPATSIANATVLYLPEGLPELLDVSGAESGWRGKSGGSEWYHPKQVIRIARGKNAVASVVDAPTLRLPPTQNLVANLVAVSTLAPVPPAGSVERYLRTLNQERVEVVPPPPDQRDQLTSRLLAPSPVIAPPSPEIDRSMPTAKLTPPPTEIVPPPPTAHAASNLRGVSSDTPAVVPPPPAVHGKSSARLYMPDIAVVPPAPNEDPTLARAKTIAVPSFEVVPPPPLARVAGQARNVHAGAVAVVPPPPVITRNDSSSRTVVSALPTVVRPQPGAAHLASGSASSEAGAQRTASTTARDIVVSARTGDEVGAPSGGPGTLILSPTGTAVGGIGGSGGGTGLAQGTGPAAGKSGNGSGDAHTGEGHGSDTTAHGGSNALPGPGGTGSGGAVKAPSGVTVSGGVVHLPSFGTPSSQPSNLDASTPGEIPGIVIIASARAGNVLDPKLAPRAGRVYTVYLPTRIGVAVLQYADPDVGTSFQAALAPPQPLKTEIPPGLELTRAVVSGILDRLGALRELRIVQADDQEMAARLVAALRSWKFRPVLRSNYPVEVDAVLGFGVSTKQ